GGDTGKSMGPDLAQGIAITELADGVPVAGQFAGEPVLLVRRGERIHAIGAQCTHYGGPLAEGLVGGGTVRWPWHHACFSLATGEGLRAPALNPVPCYTVEHRGERVCITGVAPPAAARPAPARATPARIVIVGAGAAGYAAADMLRRQGYDGSVTLIG